MVNIEQFIGAHPLLIAVAGYLAFGLVETMPRPNDPRPIGQKLYQWGYDWTHLLANKYTERHPNAALPKEVKSEQ